MNKKLRILLLAGILIIAAFLRFYHFTATPPGLYPDEAMDGNNAVQAAETGRYEPFYADDNGREGLYINSVVILYQFFHAPETAIWAIRLPAAIAGVLTVLGLALLAAEIFGWDIGLLAAFFLAMSFWHVNFSRIGFRGIMAPLLLVWALYLLIKAFRTSATRAASIYSIFAGSVYALGFYTYIAYRITPLLLLLFIPFFRKHPEFWKRVLIFVVVTFIVAAPLGWYFLNHQSAFFGRTTEISVTKAQNPWSQFAINFGETALMFNLHGDTNWRDNIAGAPELFWPVGILFLLGIARGVYQLSRRKRPHDPYAERFGWWLLYTWILLAMVPAAASNEGVPHALRAILTLPPAMILAATGGVWFYKILKKWPGKFSWGSYALRVVTVVFLTWIAVFGFYEYFTVWAADPMVSLAFNQNYVDLAAKINALPRITPKYVIVTVGDVYLSDGIPTSAATVMYLTHSFTPTDRTSAHITYLIPSAENKILPGTPNENIFYIR